MKNCADCKNSYHHDTGYSNWTVEGTDVYCRFNLNPEAPFDRWFNDAKQGRFAERCEQFSEGRPWFELDCDLERLDDLTPEQRKVWEQA